MTGTGAAAFALVGCGDDDDNGGQTATATPGNGGDSSSSPSPATSNGEPVRGGTWRTALAGDPTAIDPYHGNALPTHQASGFVYDRLYRFQTGPGKDPAGYITEPNLAASMPEISDDGLTYVVKLSPDAKWHPPIERPLDAEDVVYSWDRWRGEFPEMPAHVMAPQVIAWLDSVEAVDDATVRFNLSSPRGDFLVSEDKWIVIMPRETGDAFDPNQQMVGTGPWIFESYTPGQSVNYRRNPEWHLGPDAPYFDAVEIAVIPEYAARLSQFLAGQLDELTEILGLDLGRVTTERPGTQLFNGMAGLPNSVILFPEIQTTDAPWKDARVRKAVSMSLNRDDLLDAAYNLSEIEATGHDVDRRWNNDVASFDTAYWLDPKGEYVHADGDPQITPENAALFQHNPAEARQLLEAAGYPDGFTAPFYIASAQYGEAYSTMGELTQAYGAEAGINFEIQDVDYSSVFITRIVQELDFDGGVHLPKRAGVRTNIENYFIPNALSNRSKVDDDELTGLVRGMLVDPDPESARIKTLEIQNYVNDQMYYIPMQLGASGGYTVYSPDVRNVLDYQVVRDDWGNETVPYYWREA